MRLELIEKALEKVPDRELLVNLAARRAKELANNSHPMVAVDAKERTRYLDIALREIAEGLIGYESVEDEESVSS
ncbi:MAG: DNA-directed RNA polymerase subunit omega [Lentisphaerae bacterium]|nr:MAG: DNA-directed RNA polymerase subunit omega [Lentisphaerota bacterium]